MPDPYGILHIAGDWDPRLGQLCSRCGFVLDQGLEGVQVMEGEEPPGGWEPGSTILVAEGNPTFKCDVEYLDPERDTSDEFHCEALG